MNGKIDFATSVTSGIASDVAGHIESRAPAKSMRVNVCWAFAGNLVNAGCQLGMVVVFAKLGGPHIVGEYSWAQAIVSPLMIAAMLQLRAIFVTDTSGPAQFSDYLGLRFLSMTLALLTVCGCAYFATTSWSMYLVVAAIGFSRAIDGVSDLFRGYFQKHERMDYVSKNLMLRGVLAFMAVALTIRLTGDLAASTAALCAAWILISIIYDLPQARFVAKNHGESDCIMLRVNWSTIRSLLPAALPMGLVIGLVTLQTSIPRLFLEPWGGSAAVGYYSAAFYPIMTGMLIIGAVGESALPRLNRLAFVDRHAFLKLLAGLEATALVTGLLVAGVAALAGRPLLELAYAPAFGAYHFEFFLLALSALFSFMASLLGYGLTAARRFYIQPVMALLSCAVTAAGCLLWIPQYGVAGAAYAQIASAVVTLLAAALCMFWACRQMPLPALSQ